jgi:RNA polymerase sigma-70 factor (ECF subfamily)
MSAARALITRPGLPAPAPAVSSDSESLLVRQAQAGDRSAFDQLVRAHIARALRIARRLVPTHEDAEDVVQDAFLSAMRAINSFDVSRPFGPWLTRIVVNQGITVRRARARRQDEGLFADLPAAGPSPALVTERNEITDRFRAALELLSEQQRLMIQLFEVDGLSSPEIATLTGLSDGTVRWHIHAARKVLRRALAPLRHDGEHDDE